MDISNTESNTRYSKRLVKIKVHERHLKYQKNEIKLKYNQKNKHKTNSTKYTQEREKRKQQKR